MDTLKGNRLCVAIIIIVLLGSSCIRSSIKKIEDLVGFPLREQLILKHEESQWIDFIGDGYKMEVYSVEKNFIHQKINTLKSKGFIEYNSDSWTGSEVYPYIAKSYGLYKNFKTNNDEYSYVFINIDKSLIIYFYEIY